jgi:hypothetical protein
MSGLRRIPAMGAKVDDGGISPKAVIPHVDLEPRKQLMCNPEYFYK